MDKIIKIYKYFLIVVFCGIFFAICWQYFSLRGSFSLQYDFCGKPRLISEFYPSGRSEDREKNMKTGECYQRLSNEPVYFDATVPRSFNEVEVKLEYKNPSQNIIEVGILKSEAGIADLKPFENKFIDSSTWEKLAKDNLLLFQKEKKYNSIDEFINNLPLDKKIATYNYQPKYNFIIPDYQPSSQYREFNQTLRGKHEFYTYLENEDLDFIFQWQNINNSEEKFVVKVYHDNSELNTFFSSSATLDTNQEKQVNLTDLSGGLYKIVIDVSENVLITKISTKQHLLVVKDKIILHPKGQINNIFTNSDELIFRTEEESGLQNVKIDNDQLKINKISSYFNWQNNNQSIGSFKDIQMEKNNLLIQGFGYFAMTAESFFDPDNQIDKLRNNSDIEQYDYLIAAGYTSPIIEADWKKQTVKLDLSGVIGDRKNLVFLLSSPNLANSRDDILIKKIELNLSRQPMTIADILKKFLNKHQ